MKDSAVGLDRVVEFLRLSKSQSALEKRDFDILYDLAQKHLIQKDGNYVGVLTSLLYTSDINPLVASRRIPNSFLYQQDITTFHIPQCIEEIGSQAFRRSTLTSIIIPSNVKRIEINAFRECQDLTDVILEEGVEFLGESTFRDCFRLKKISWPCTLAATHRFALRGTMEDLLINFNGAVDQFIKIRGIREAGISPKSRIRCIDTIIPFESLPLHDYLL